MISIVDLGIGNYANVAKATGGKITSDQYDIARAEKLIIPGVGSASSVAGKLSELRGTIEEKIAEGTPVLGICLGMQLMTSMSTEGNVPGLDIFGGTTDRFKFGRETHIGWNTIRKEREDPLLEGVENDTYFYFVHSYRVYVDSQYIIATAEFNGEVFPSAISKENVSGVQFHPEKSSTAGKRVLANFAKGRQLA